MKKIILFCMTLCFFLHAVHAGEPPKRIISFTPSLTETIFALGAGDSVVGTTDWCNHPAAAKTRPRLGGVYNPNYERMLALNPDLLVVSAALEQIASKAESLGIRVLRVPIETLEDIPKSIEILGQALGQQQRAQKMIEQFHNDLRTLEMKLKDISPPKVLLVLERRPGTVLDLTIVGSNNVIDSLIQLAGAQNIFPNTPIAYPKINKEEILARAPEIILDFSVHGLSDQGNDADALADWRVLSSLPAVQNKKVMIIRKGFDLYPGPRIPEIVTTFAKMFHPERFQDSL